MLKLAWIVVGCLLFASASASSQTKTQRSPEELSALCLQHANLGACAERLLIAQKLNEPGEGISFARKLCELGTLSACTQVAELRLAAKDDADASKWLARACAGGDEVDGKGCSLRAEMADRHGQPKAAGRFRSHACRAGLKSACATPASK